MFRESDKVRFYLGDTDSTDPLLQDEEILFALSEYGGPRLAAAACCDSLAAKNARLADLAEGQLRISYSQRYKQFLEMAAVLRSRAAVLAVPSAGGISISDKEAAEGDTDRVSPSFTVDILDNEMVGHLDTTQGTIEDERS